MKDEFPIDGFIHLLDVSKGIFVELFTLEYKKKSLVTDSKIWGRIRVMALNPGLHDKQIL